MRKSAPQSPGLLHLAAASRVVVVNISSYIILCFIKVTWSSLLCVSCVEHIAIIIQNVWCLCFSGYLFILFMYSWLPLCSVYVLLATSLYPCITLLTWSPTCCTCLGLLFHFTSHIHVFRIDDFVIYCKYNTIFSHYGFYAYDARLLDIKLRFCQVWKHQEILEGF